MTLSTSFKENAKNVKAFFNTTTGQNLAVNHKGIELIVSLLMSSANYRRRINYTTGKGRFTSAMISMLDDYTLVLDSLGVAFETGNDAPKGGKHGDFIFVTEIEKLREMFASFEVKK